MIKATSTVTGADFADTYRRKANNTLKRILDWTRDRVKVLAPADTGELRNAVFTVIESPLPNFVGGVVAAVQHASIMDEGVAPGAWGMKAAHRRVSHATSHGETISFKPFLIPNVDYAALGRWSRRHGLNVFAVAWSIYRNGIRARRFFTQAVVELEGHIVDMLGELSVELEAAWKEG